MNDPFLRAENIPTLLHDEPHFYSKGKKITGDTDYDTGLLTLIAVVFYLT